MVIDQKQLSELTEAAKPLRAFLLKHCHPHCHVTVDSDRVELVEGVAGSPIPENTDLTTG